MNIDKNKTVNDNFVDNNVNTLTSNDNGYLELSPDMTNETERLKTFKNWPVSFLSAIDMAKCGFYYLNKNDEVRCAYCKIEIMNWKNGDDPESDHRRYAPQCPFIFVCNTKTAIQYAKPAHPSYSTINNRLATFKNWPRFLTQTPDELSKAGFYYTGCGDMVKCYYCDGGLKDWEQGDIPWEQHACWFPRCFHVLLVKGEDYIQKIISNACVIPAKTTSSELCEENKLTIENDNELCKICFNDKRNVCFVPCGHIIACAQCALSSNECFLCRAKYNNIIRVYFG